MFLAFSHCKIVIHFVILFPVVPHQLYLILRGGFLLDDGTKDYVVSMMHAHVFLYLACKTGKGTKHDRT